MKEYLRKNQDETYSYIGTVQSENVYDDLIEIPEGAELLVYFSEDSKNYFYKGADEIFKCNQWIKTTGVWSALDIKLGYVREILWQRSETKNNRIASDIADAALKHIRERASTYDQQTGERSASKTAQAFNAITGKDITESEVWLILQLLKDVRQWSREEYHQDSAEDCIAYAALKAESLERGI